MKNSMEADPQFIDTWGWLLLANDPSYSSVFELRSDATSHNDPWVTTDYVLDEALTGLFASTRFSKAVRFVDSIFKAQKIGSLAIERIDPQRFDNAWKLRLRYVENQSQDSAVVVCS